MPVEVFQEPLRRKYYTSHFSCGYFFFLLTITIGVILPFFLAYGSYGFWLKDGKYFEQPKVTYKYKFITQLSGEDANQKPFQLFYSSVAGVNALRSNVRVPTVRSREIDKNVDGNIDGLNFEFEMPLKSGEKIKSVSTMIFFEYMLNERVKLMMRESMAYITGSNSLEGTSYYTKGNVKFQQTKPLAVGGSYDCDDCGELFAAHPQTSASDTSMRNLLEKVCARKRSP